MQRSALFALILCWLVLPACNGAASLSEVEASPAASHSGPSLEAAVAELEALAPPAGTDSELFAKLKQQLKDVLIDLHGRGKVTAAPPQDPRSQSALSWDYYTRTLSWDYYNTGDYNQDGFVTVNDLTPVGVHFDKDTDSPDWEAASMADGNFDGMITVSDITPIGQAFGCSVTSYNVYVSADAEDYPTDATEDNGSADLLGTVQFIDGETASGVRMRFSYEVEEYQAGDSFWVRPSDGTAEGIASDQVALAPALEPAFTFENPGEFGGINDIALLGEYAAAVIHEADSWDDGRLLFAHATNTEATEWTTPMELSATNNPGSFASMAVIGGNPAIAYQCFTGSLQELWYVRAEDTVGDSWGSPVLVDDGAGTGHCPALLEADGRPAIAFHQDDGADKRVMYIRAEDELGTTWLDDPDEVVPPTESVNTGYVLSAALIDDRPAIAYTVVGADDAALGFISAQDAAGTAWNSPVQLDSFETALIDFTMSLVDAGGVPGLAYHLDYYTGEADNAAYYTHGNDASGTTWSDPVEYNPAKATASVSRNTCDEEPENETKAIVMSTVDNDDGTKTHYSAEYHQWLNTGSVIINRGQLDASGMLDKRTSEFVSVTGVSGAVYLCGLKMKAFKSGNYHCVVLAITYRDSNNVEHSKIFRTEQ